MFTKKEVAHLAQNASLTTRKSHSGKSNNPSSPAHHNRPGREIRVCHSLPSSTSLGTWNLGVRRLSECSMHISMPVHAFRIFHLVPSTWTLATIRSAYWQTSRSLSSSGTSIFTRYRRRLAPASRCKHNKRPPTPFSAFPILPISEDDEALPRSIGT